MAMVVGLADGSHCEDGDGGKVDFDKAAILAGKSVPHDSWKLKGLVVVMSEKETELDSRLTALLNLLDDNEVTNDASLHMRLYGDAAGVRFVGTLLRPCVGYRWLHREPTSSMSWRRLAP